MANEPKKRTHSFRKGERITRAWAQKVENFVSTFRVLSGGQFIFDGRDAVLQCFASGGRWTGILWYGNDITDFSAMSGWPADVVDGKYLVVNLLDGTTSWTDDLGTLDDSNEQAFWVADEVSTGVYRLNNHTQGDIHARIT